MRWFTTLRLRLRSLLLRQRVDSELDAELEFHLEHLIGEHLARGKSVDEARRLAHIELGGPSLGRDACRDTRGLGAWETITRDLRFAARSLRRSRGFSASAITSLALGLTLLGTTSTIVAAYLGRSLPAQDADRLFHVWYSGAPGQIEPGGLSALDWSALADIVDMADSSIFARYTITESGFTQELVGVQVSRESIDGLGLDVVAGRSLQDQDFTTGEEPVLIGDRLWRDRFNGDPDVLGRGLQVVTASAGAPLSFRVIGILPPGFRYVREYSRSEVDLVSPHRSRGRVYMVRLREGVTPQAAGDRITALIRQAPDVEIASGWPGVRLESVHSRYVAPIRPLLTTAWLAAACVLLIVASNIAVLVMLRSLRRRREVAVRMALGAGWPHLVRGVLAEALILCLAAAGLSAVLTGWLVSMLATSVEESLGRVAPGAPGSIALDWTVLGLVAAITLLVMVAISVVALAATRRGAAAGLRGHSRAGLEGAVVRWARTSLVTIEVAGSIALLAGCGLMVRTALTLVDAQLGMTTTGVVRTRVALPAVGYTDGARRLDFYDRLASEVRSRSGAEIAFANWALLSEPARSQDVDVDDTETASTRAAVTAISEAYTSVLGIPVIEGRALAPTDRRGTEPVALVSASLARRLWPAGSAVGRRVRGADLSQAGEPVGPWRTIVGVVGDVRQTPMDDDPNDVYVPLLQVPTQFASVMIKTADAPSTWIRTLRDIVGRIDPHVMIGVTTSLEAERDHMLSGRRLLASLLAGFAIFATFLTLVGVYGVTAHAARQREAEVALRLALGATQGQVTRLLMTDMLKVLAAGLVVGALGASIVGGALESQLHQLSSLDPLTLIVTTAGILAAALLAAWVPVRRTAALSPARVLQDS